MNDPKRPRLPLWALGAFTAALAFGLSQASLRVFFGAWALFVSDAHASTAAAALTTPFGVDALQFLAASGFGAAGGLARYVRDQRRDGWQSSNLRNALSQLFVAQFVGGLAFLAAAVMGWDGPVTVLVCAFCGFAADVLLDTAEKGGDAVLRRRLGLPTPSVDEEPPVERRNGAPGRRAADSRVNLDSPRGYGDDER